MMLLSVFESDCSEEARKELLQAIEALVDTSLHAGFDHGVAVLDALVHRVAAQHRPPVALLERDRVQRYMAGRALELEGLDHRIRRRHAMEDTVKAVLGPVLVAVDVAPS